MEEWKESCAAFEANGIIGFVQGAGPTIPDLMRLMMRSSSYSEQSLLSVRMQRRFRCCFLFLHFHMLPEQLMWSATMP